MLPRLFGDTRGAITILTAFSMVAVIGCSALALEFGYGLLRRVENQRVADIAAYGGALVYNSTGSTSSTSSAVGKIASLNGLASTAATSAVVSSPSGDGNQAVQVTVTTSDPLVLAKVVSASTTLPVSATAYAEIKASAPGCVIALSGSGTGVSLTGGATLTASDCAVASNTTVTAHACSNTITTKYVDYNTTAPNPSCALVPPSGTPSVKQSKVLTADPLSGNSEVTGATSRISSVASMTSPAAPSVSAGSAVNFGWGSSPMSVGSPACTAVLSGSTWTVTCSGGSTFTFGTITLAGGITVNFNTGGSSSVTYNINGDIDGSSGTALSFGPGTYNIKGAIIAAGNMPISFGAGTFNIGTATNTSNCGNTNGYSICVNGSGRITFAGPSTFVLAGGIYANASGMPPSPALSLGYGTATNSFTIGKSSNGYSLNQSNGSTLFGNTNTAFQIAGNLATTGGTCVALPAAAQHDINGYLGAAGGVYLGSGVYTINGYVALGNSSGGDVSNCPTSGTTTGLTGLEVTLVISGASAVSCGSTASAFCLGAGYSRVTLTAPTSSSTLGSSTAGLAVIGPQSSSNTAAAVFTSGATNTRISGAFYFPNGPVSMSGGAALHDTVDASACLMLIGSQITLSAGSAAGTTCTGLGGSSSGATVALVQ